MSEDIKVTIDEQKIGWSNMYLSRELLIYKKSKAPYRVGRKQKRAVLDVDGHEVCLFPIGLEQMAELYCLMLNKGVSFQDLIEFVNGK